MHACARYIFNLTLIVTMFIIGNSSYLNTAISQTWHFRSLTNVDNLSNLNQYHDQSVSSSLNFTPSSSHSIARGNVSRVTNSNNTLPKMVVIMTIAFVYHFCIMDKNSVSTFLLLLPLR
jgi:hypothetical protein